MSAGALHEFGHMAAIIGAVTWGFSAAESIPSRNEMHI